MPASLGTFVRERRQALGLTQEELAERVGPTMRQAKISRLEHGRVALPRREKLEALAAALEVSLGDLLVRSGWMTDGDRPAAAVLHVETLSASDARYPQGVADLAELVTNAQAMVTNATRTNEQAARALAQAQQVLGLAGYRDGPDPGEAPLALPLVVGRG